MRFLCRNTIDYSKIDIIKEKYKILMDDNNISFNIEIRNTIDLSKYQAQCLPVSNLNLNYNYEIELTKKINDEMELEELEAIIAHEFGHAIIFQDKIKKLTNSKCKMINFFRRIRFFMAFKNSLEIETQADEEALKITENSEALINALIKIDGLRKMEKWKNFIYKCLLIKRQPIYPSLENRINHIRNFKNYKN